ncbi:MAG: PH domain-containing protein [Deltaproteobacteria bacterium]|nr:PH domain-containing protein [Deltaproteobacteria bacterium]
MAMIECSECGNAISDKAKACPQCGAPVSVAVAERPLRTFTPSMLGQDAKRFFWLAVIAVLTCGLGLVLLIPWWVRLSYTRLMVTNQRITLTEGVFSKRESEVLLEHIRNVSVHQTALQRMVGAGDVGISCSGQSEIELNVHGLRDPHALKQMIDENRAGI